MVTATKPDAHTGAGAGPTQQHPNDEAETQHVVSRTCFLYRREAFTLEPRWLWSWGEALIL